MICRGFAAGRRSYGLRPSVAEESEELFLPPCAGVVGYVLKDAFSSDVLEAVRLAAQGEAAGSP